MANTNDQDMKRYQNPDEQESDKATHARETNQDTDVDMDMNLNDDSEER